MKIDLTDTTASKINKALVQGRRAIGSPAVGMVLTLVIVTDEENAYDALKAAGEASREHPSRKLVVIKRVSRSPRDRTASRLDAEVRVGADAGTGETVVLRLYGEAINHAQSVVLPLLLPDAPVVAWWPVNAPLDPANDPLGALAQRRVTDTYAAEQPIHELASRAETYTPGDTDLSWTRITPWRSMLAAALDQVTCQVTAVGGGGRGVQPERRAACHVAGGPPRCAGQPQSVHRAGADLGPHGDQLRPDHPGPGRRLPGHALHAGPAGPRGGAQAARDGRADRGGAAQARPGRHLRLGAEVRCGPARRGGSGEDGAGAGGRPEGAAEAVPAKKTAAKSPAKKATSKAAASK